MMPISIIHDHPSKRPNKLAMQDDIWDLCEALNVKDDNNDRGIDSHCVAKMQKKTPKKPF